MPVPRFAARDRRGSRATSSALVFALILCLLGCSPSDPQTAPVLVDPDERPTRFTIVPDDYHVPYAGTAEDGRRFFLSDELFGEKTSYVGLFLWTADGEFDSIRVDPVSRNHSRPPGQAGSSGAEAIVRQRLQELGDYTMEPITVEPFTRKVRGEVFGWRVTRHGGQFAINIEPGDFIAYYAPWDGFEYDT